MKPQDYFALVKDLKSPVEIKAVVDKLLNGIMSDSYAESTRVKKLVPYNKLIKSIPDEDLVEGQNAYIQKGANGVLWKRHLHFRYTGIEKVNFNGEGGINTKTKVLNRLTNKQLLPVQEYLEATVKLLESNDPYELAVGLIAASGRRSIEILVRGNFEIEDNLPSNLKPGYFVKFSGQAKKRDDEEHTYRIGVLVPAKSFILAFKKFRAFPEIIELLEFVKNSKESHEQINADIEDRRGNSLRRVCARSFKGVTVRNGDLELNPKSLRAMYVAIITERDCPKQIHSLLWSAQALGHFINSETVTDSDLKALGTTLGYSDFYLETEVPFLPELTINFEEQPMTATTIESVESVESMESNQETMKEKSVRVSPSAFEKIKQFQTELGLNSQQATIDKLLEMLEDLNKPKTPKTERELEGLSWAELKPLRGDDATSEKILRAFTAITKYNDEQPSNESRWYIGNTSLGHLCGCNAQTISQWINNHKISVDDANSKYGLGTYHNTIHRKSKIKINELIEDNYLEPPSPTTPANSERG